MDNTQMVAQMAQLSQVQGITDLNTTVKGFQDQMSGDQILRGAALVGHDVLIPSTKWSLETEGATNGMVAAPGAGFVNVDITDANGVKVNTISVEAKAAGEVTFEWDGKDANGNRLAPGTYGVTASIGTGEAKKDLSTYVESRVDSVTVGSDGVFLDLAGLGTAPLDYVLRIR
jgi:flagellar basal-body rod modification protein FlgD